MSGGVDSSVTAYLMAQKGYRCQGATMRLYRNQDIGRSPYRTCCAQQDMEDASQVAFQLDIPYEVLDLTAEFRREVMEKFARVYEEGGTPNPCIDCNRFLKFEHFLQAARDRGLSDMATGHYARIAYDEAAGRYLLKKARDASKDQSYVLYMLTQEELAHTHFPLGERTKEEVRALAAWLGFCNARKADSQDICFVPEGDYVAFLEGYRGRAYPGGDFLDQTGTVVGRHRGAVGYTLGQRKGLGLAMGRPVYVCAKDMAANTVTVGPEEALYADTLWAEDLNWIAIPRLEGPLACRAKTRYRQTEAPATAYPAGEGRMKLVFSQPQRAMTVGQAVVLYQGDLVLGGGTIVRVGPDPL